MIREIAVDAHSWEEYRAGVETPLMCDKNQNIGTQPVTVRIVCHANGRTFSRMAELTYMRQLMGAFMYKVEFLIKGPM